jgi:hypothetical protein
MIAGGFVTIAAMAALMLASGTAQAANAVKFEAIPGSAIKRVILTAKAAERLGIELNEVEERSISRKRMFGGQVIHKVQVRMARKKKRSAFGGFSRTAAKAAPQASAAQIKGPSAGEAWIRLLLSREEWSRVAKDKPARILPLATRGGMKKELVARVSKLPAYADPKRSMLTVYYVVEGTDHGLKPKSRIRVELRQKGSNKKRKVVPYSALYYDDRGVSWVYANTKPLTFERKRVEVERIDGDNVILKAGPDVGTPVATVGVAQLYGAEVIFKR